jgi:hypothetical protein
MMAQSLTISTIKTPSSSKTDTCPGEEVLARPPVMQSGDRLLNFRPDGLSPFDLHRMFKVTRPYKHHNPLKGLSVIWRVITLRTIMSGHEGGRE